MPPSSGPGRYRALVAMMSLKWSGFIFCNRSRIPRFRAEDAFRFAACNRANVFCLRGEFVGINANTGRLLDQIDGFGEDRGCEARNPSSRGRRFDIAHRPLSDDVGLVLHAQSSTYSVSGRSAITTAAACVPTLRARPLDLRARSRTRELRGRCRRYAFRSSPDLERFVSGCRVLRHERLELVDAGDGPSRGRGRHR